MPNPNMQPDPIREDESVRTFNPDHLAGAAAVQASFSRRHAVPAVTSDEAFYGSVNLLTGAEQQPCTD